MARKLNDVETAAMHSAFNAMHANAVERGWWEGGELPTPDEIGAKLALIHSEVSEALEELRSGRWLASRIEDGKPEGFVVELADVVIRCADLCGRLNLDLAGAIEQKHTYNLSRPYRHGGKVL